MSERAAIYVRISSDPAGLRAGVERQVRECQELCRARQWQVVEVYEDNDRSAYSGKPRPAYQRLLKDIRSGHIAALAIWHPDRLHRSPIELEGFIALVEETGLRIGTVAAGEYDLSTVSGRMSARIVGAVARQESEHKAERQRTANHHRRIQGHNMTGGRYRTFGFQRDGIRLHQEEAELVRKAVRRILAGGSLHAICEEWAADGVITTGGRRWRTTALRRYLENPRLAGWVGYDGNQVARAEGVPIRGQQETLIEPDLWEVLQVRLGRRGRRPMQSARKRLLAGFLTCGREECGKKLYSYQTGSGKPAYKCIVAEGGCGKISGLAAPIERRVIEAVVQAVEELGGVSAVIEILRMRESSHSSAELLAEVEAIETGLERLIDLYQEGLITRSQFCERQMTLKEQLTTTQERLFEVGRHLDVSIPESVSTSDWWLNSEIPLDMKRQVLTVLGVRILLRPHAKRGDWRFDPSRVRIALDALQSNQP